MNPYEEEIKMREEFSQVLAEYVNSAWNAWISKRQNDTLEYFKAKKCLHSADIHVHSTLDKTQVRSEIK